LRTVQIYCNMIILEDEVYIESVQEDEHVSQANDDTPFNSTLPEPSSCK
jgi:hypothetical protein